jgi:pimeloyl-ACP methyl ester carboxylesterase
MEGRAALDGAELVLRTPSLARVPKGRGAPVLVLPGFGASDVSTAVLRRFLRHHRHDAVGWGMGTNRGDVPDLVPKVIALAAQLADRGGGPIPILGWSLGGVLARETARERPDLVRRVITMGTPVVGGPKYTLTARAYAARGADLDEIEAIVDARNRVPISVPITALWSKNDGVVDWRACIDRHNPVEHVQVRATHLGMGASAEVFDIVARRLAINDR